jgi:hypothetical protein
MKRADTVTIKAENLAKLRALPPAYLRAWLRLAGLHSLKQFTVLYEPAGRAKERES